MNSETEEEEVQVVLQSRVKLELELILPQNWHVSLANLLPKPVWDTLRREVYRKFNYTCIYCGATDVRVNCHETWEYDDKKRIQRLGGFQCLCDDCHNIKHWGRTVALVHEGKLQSGYLEELTGHFCRVNRCSPEDFSMHKVRMGDLLQKRNRHKYRVDFGKFEPSKVIEVWRKEQGRKQ